MLRINASKTDIDVLNYERFHNNSISVRGWMNIIYLKHHGFKHQDISLIVGCGVNAITNTVKRYNLGGIEAILLDKRGGQECELKPFYPLLMTTFQNNLPHTSKEAMAMVEQVTGISKSIRTIQTTMHRLGMSYRKTAQIPAKADVQRQAQFVENILNPLIGKAESGKCELLFVDAAHFVWGPFLSFLWSFTKVFIPAPSGRKRLNVLGALNAISHELTAIVNQTGINADTIGSLLQKVRDSYPGRQIYIVLDNASVHRTDSVRVLARKLKINLVYLPPYSPNLNIIERLWRWVKKDALNSKYYPTFNEFTSGIINSLNKLNSMPEGTFDTTFSLNFQTFEDSHVQAA